MADMMIFPDTVEEFMEQYKMVDTEQVYSNGIEYVPIFRMMQWFEHKPERKKSTDNGCTFLTCKHGGDDACSKCRWAYRDMYEPDEEGAQE